MHKERKGSDVQGNYDSIGDPLKQCSVLHQSENIHAFQNDKKYNHCPKLCLHGRDQKSKCFEEYGRDHIDCEQIQ